MNRSAYIKRQLFAEVMNLLHSNRLVEDIDQVPVKLFPRSRKSYRCCVYKDRAMIRLRILAILGFSQEQEDQGKSLSFYAAKALERREVPGAELSLFEELCSGCDGGSYRVTEVCRSCVARSCSEACPRDALSFGRDRAEIDQDKCVSCGKCQQACAYHAVVYLPVPCEEVCPVQAISKDDQGRRSIDGERCIHCGRCVTQCPFGAPLDVSQLVDVHSAMNRGIKVNALVAPAVLSQFPGEPERLRGALLQLGFAGVYDVAQGAAQVAKLESEEGQEAQGPLFTSCCPSWVMAAEKHIPQVVDRISHTPSPMALTGEKCQEEDPQAWNVFIGPCFSKKMEAQKLKGIHAVLTFEELGAMLMSRDIQLDQCPAVGYSPLEGWEASSRENRLFARSGGVGQNLEVHLSGAENIEAVDGLDKKSLKRLAMAEKFYGEADFVEVMSCAGGCIAGPGNITPPGKALKWLEERS